MACGSSPQANFRFLSNNEGGSLRTLGKVLTSTSRLHLYGETHLSEREKKWCDRPCFWLRYQARIPGLSVRSSDATGGEQGVSTLGTYHSLWRGSNGTLGGQWYRRIEYTKESEFSPSSLTCLT